MTGGDPAAVRALEDRATDNLRRAIKAGFQELPPLKQDACLGSLRGRPDFRLLLLDLAMPSDPFAPGR